MYPCETACPRFLEKRGPAAGLTVAAVVVPLRLGVLRSEVTATLVAGPVGAETGEPVTQLRLGGVVVLAQPDALDVLGGNRLDSRGAP